MHLPAIQFDHCPLLLRSAPDISHPQRPFKFETMWTLSSETTAVIQDAWSRGFTLQSKTKHTKQALKIWNREVFGHVQTRINHLKHDIAILQGLPPDSDTIAAEPSKHWELDELLKQEEILW